MEVLSGLVGAGGIGAGVDGSLVIAHRERTFAVEIVALASIEE
jgi:hypothetical protein